MGRIISKAKKIWGYLRSMPSGMRQLMTNKMLWKPEMTYFPDKQSKDATQIFMEQLWTVIKCGHVNTYYFLYGFDCKTRSEQNEYMQYDTFRWQRNARNEKSHLNPICVLRDKDLFSIVGQAYGMPVLKTVGEIQGGKLVMDGANVSIPDFLSKDGHWFFKPVGAECGKGIFSLDIVSGRLYVNDKETNVSETEKFFQSLGKENYIVQERLIQHPEMKRLYPNSVNTIRVVTIDTGKDVEVFASELRIGANGSIVDNLATGGIAVGISGEGYLLPVGFYKPPFGTKTTVHPDTKIEFASFQIPFYKEAIDFCKKFHSKLKGMHSIGWDIAITERGPVFIEGNDNWEITGLQVCNGGLKRRWCEMLGK